VQQDQKQQIAADSGAVAQLAQQTHDAVDAKRNEIDEKFAKMALASGFGNIAETQKNDSEHKCKKPVQKNQPIKNIGTRLISDFEDKLPYDEWHDRVFSWFDHPENMLVQDAYCDLSKNEQDAAVQRHLFPCKVDDYVKKIGIRSVVRGGGFSYNIPGKLIRGNETESGVFSWGVNKGLCYHRCFSRENRTVSPSVQALIGNRLASRYMEQRKSHSNESTVEQKSKGCLVKADDRMITVIDNKTDIKAVLYKPTDHGV
jgi:hypothetical protein